MKQHITKYQGFITLFLSLTLFALIVAKVVYPDLDLEIPFSMIAGWLGVVIGFFFNQEFSKFFQEKYNKSEDSRLELIKETEKQFEEYKEKYFKLKESLNKKSKF